jgi:hypothetical protein
MNARRDMKGTSHLKERITRYRRLLVEKDRELEEMQFKLERQAEMITELRELFQKDMDLIPRERTAKELGLEGVNPQTIIVNGKPYYGPTTWRSR